MKLFGSIKLAASYYHGSPVGGLTSLRKGSYVSKDRAIAELMGRYHLDSGKTWTDDDLAEPYYFGKEPKWKKEPMGKAQLYKLRAKLNQLELLDNPYEHRTAQELSIKSY